MNGGKADPKHVPGDNPTRVFHRPLVTVTYAQSLDGCIATSGRKRLHLSGRRSLALTHRLRASHDAILIGIGTVLSDDPRLTVRYVQGKNPRPVIFDSRLRFPLDARILKENPEPPWIITIPAADLTRGTALQETGVSVCTVPPDDSGMVDVDAALDLLYERGIRSVMVEGGAQIITSFFSKRAVDRVVLTVSPVILGGLRAVSGTDGEELFDSLRLQFVSHRWLGEDLVLEGKPAWER